MDMKRIPTAATYSGASFILAAALAAAVLWGFGTGPAGLVHALQLTARFSFILFWLAYAGGALKTLFGSPFQTIAWHGRDFGLAFAAAHVVHVALVIWLFHISNQPPVSGPLFAFFTIGLFWTYLLAVLSIRRLARALGQWRWRMLRLAGMEYISFAFLLDFVNHRVHGPLTGLIFYAPFATLSLLGTFLRFGAWASRGAAVAKSA
jgi:hypothetical protein